MRVALVAALCALSFSVSSEADAQRRQRRQVRQPTTVVRHATPPLRSNDALQNALADFHQSLLAHGIRGPVAQATAHLEQVLVHHRRGARAHLEQDYRRLRRLVHRSQRIDEDLLDLWDEVALHATEMRRRPARIPNRPPAGHVNPGHGGHGHGGHGHGGHGGYGAQNQLRFEGSFERTPAVFTGRTPDEIYAQCIQFVSAVRLTHVDDITVFGTAHRNGPGYWGNESLCAMSALNARAAGQAAATVTGHVEGLPFALGGPRHQVRATIERYLSTALQGQRHIDDIVVAGRSYRNSASYWTAAQAAQLVLSQI